MDYQIDDEVAALRTTLLGYLRERQPDPVTEPGRDTRLAAWRELVASEWLEHFATDTRDNTKRVVALHVAEAFGAVPVAGPVNVVAGYLLPLAIATRWTTGLERLRSGSLITGIVPRLIGAGPDALPNRCATRLPAVRDDDIVRVTGALPQVACAADAAAVVVSVELEGQPALVLIDLDRAGVTVGGSSGVDLRRPVADVILRGVQIDAVAVHKTPNLLDLENSCADLHSLFLDAEAIGGGSELIARTVAYCSSRAQFGRPIGSFQAVRHRLAGVAVQVEGARSLAYQTAWDVAAGSPRCQADVVASRLWSSAAYVAAGEAAVQCHGGMGFTWEQGVHVLYRAALAGRAGADLTAARATLAAHLRTLASPAMQAPCSGGDDEAVAAMGGPA
ncbi:acyl-CoA dehydrogenase family protein [soil metagenome]